MSAMQYRQSRGPRASDPVAQHAGYLIITSAPARALVGKRLIDAGELAEGVYGCEIDTSGWEDGFDVVLKPSAVSGGAFAPSVAAVLLDRETSAGDPVVGDNFASDTAQTVAFPASGGLRGTSLATVTFEVPAGETIEFGAGAIAEFHGR